LHTGRRRARIRSYTRVPRVARTRTRSFKKVQEDDYGVSSSFGSGGRGGRGGGSSWLEFRHPYFVLGKPELLTKVRRRGRAIQSAREQSVEATMVQRALPAPGAARAWKCAV
jgi:hypothetical protein